MRTVFALATCLVAADFTSAFLSTKQSRCHASNLPSGKVSLSMSVIADASSSVTETFQNNVMTTYSRYPIVMVRGKGCILFDSEDKSYLDFVGGISTCCLGHGHDGLAEAVTKQIQTLHHVSNLYYIPQQGDLAKWLVDNSPADKAFFCNSGAEANEAAIKLARKHASKRGIESPTIITAISSFHGRTLGALTATGQEKYQKGFGPMLPGFKYVPYNDVEALAAAVKEVQATKGEGGGLAAIMMEALQGEGGIRPGSQDFFRAARDLCDESGALLMCDEVQVGMGRTGHMWGFQNFNKIEPDVFTLAKALGGGVPIGAMLCKDHCAVFGPGDHASTYGGNPLACAAGLTVAKAIEEEKLLENVAARGAELRAGLEGVMAEKGAGLVADVRGWGLIQGLELSQDGPVTAGEVVGECIKGDGKEGSKGLLLVPAGTHVVRFVPPLVVSADEIKESVELFKAGYERALAAKQ